MSQTRTPGGRPDEAGRYEIRLTGHLDSRWSDWFDGLALTREPDGTSLLEGPVVDQAALHGLLQKVRDTGLPLVSVNPVAPTAPAPDTPADDRPAEPTEPHNLNHLSQPASQPARRPS